MRDDFGWIAHSSVGAWQDVARLFLTAPTGFFRPVVSLSFAANQWACGPWAWCYGMVNFSLAVACAVAVALLARALSLRTGAALLAAALWLFNWHGINMAILWTSGRTALLLTLCATLGMVALVAGRSLVGVALIAGAMFSKEEGVLLPLIVAAWLIVDARIRSDWSRVRRLAPAVLCTFAADALYLLLRSQSGALTASTAPDYYRFSFTLGRLAVNLPEYLDRSITLSAAIMLLYIVAGRVRLRSVPPATASVLSLSLVWWIGSFAITMFLPLRSSLYALLPSVGAALAAGAIASLTWDSIAASRQRHLIAAGVMVPFLLWPVYHARNRRSVREADLSRLTLAELQRIATARGPGTSVLLEDDESAQPSLHNAFGSGVQLAADISVSPPIRVWLSPLSDERVAPDARPSRYDVRLVMSNGLLSEQPASH